MTLKTLAACALLAATALTTTRAEHIETGLPITGITHDTVNVTLTWGDYKDLQGFKLYYKDKLEDLVWKSVNESHDLGSLLTKLGSDGLGHDVFALDSTSVKLTGTETDRRFYRLVAVKGVEGIPVPGGDCDSTCDCACDCGCESLTIVQGTGGDEGKIFVKIGEDLLGTNIHVKVDENGLSDYPPSYWKLDGGGNWVRVWPDPTTPGKWVETQPDCVCDPCEFACAHAYPVPWDKDERMWTLVEGTQYIYAQANPDGSLKHPPYHIWSRYPLPDYDPENADPESLVIEPVYWDDPEWKGEYPNEGDWVTLPDLVATTPPGTPSVTTVYLINVSATSKDYGTQNIGYSNASLNEQFIVINDGNAGLTGVSATFANGLASVFEISVPLNPTTLAAKGVATLVVRPKAGLAAGTYTDTLKFGAVELGGTTVDVELKFVVTSVPGPVPGNLVCRNIGGMVMATGSYIIPNPNIGFGGYLSLPNVTTPISAMDLDYFVYLGSITWVGRNDTTGFAMFEILPNVPFSLVVYQKSNPSNWFWFYR